MLYCAQGLQNEFTVLAIRRSPANKIASLKFQGLQFIDKDYVVI